MKKTFFLLLGMQLLAACLYGQKKPLDHSVYDAWQSIQEIVISDDGKFTSYCVNPQEGDGMLVVTNPTAKKTVSVDRGYKCSISKNSLHAVALVKPLFSQTREAKIKKKKAEDMPKDSMAIISLADGKLEKIPYVKSFKLPEEAANVLAYHIDPPADTAKSKKTLKKEKEEGSPLVLRQLASGKEDTIRYVSSYHFSKNGKQLAVAITPNSKDSTTAAGVMLYNTANGERKMLSSGKGRYKNFSFDEAGVQLAYTAERDSAKADPKIHKLYYYAAGQDSAVLIVDQATAGMPKGWAVSENDKLRFSKSGKRLFFGTAPIPEPKDTTIYDFEVAKLDIWHYADDYVQPQQLKNLEKELKRSHTAVLYLSGKPKMLQLGDEDLSITTTKDSEEAYVLGVSTKGYRAALQWDGDVRSDLYAVSLATGERKPIVKALLGTYRLSPDGRYIVWYNRDTRHYYAYNVETAATACLTDKIAVNFWDEENDIPDKPWSYGIAGWLPDSKAVLLYDFYDIWQLDPNGKLAPVNVTNSYGRENKLVFRYIQTDSDEQYISEQQPLMLSAFDKVSKQRGFYTKQLAKPKELPIKRVLEGYSFSRPVKAKNADVVLFTKGNFSTTPDLHITSDWWKTSQQLSHINPQMKSYLWGTAELMKYRTFNGVDAEAIVYKPENFDPSKKYPVMIYFYEKHTDELYRHTPPAPSRSIINIPFFCSRGYVVMSPDIYYTDGHPGESAYSSIVAATEELCKNSWADKDNMGIQGQSWGGYQVSYLVTRTNMYKAAGAGAPVANMTSAYGGIRWGTGMVRQFQYEHTQSRIGKTLWDEGGFELYKENSPLFFADKVQTPLLIMHNDKDGAVPWYQGIEYFTALRRLGKQVWMLQYNDEDHNLVERRNTKDLSIRLQQFFDHYLKGEKMPEWMKYGLPATKKGKSWGLELVD